MAVKRSMSVRPSPIHDDETERPRYPDYGDARWVTYGYDWSGPWGYVITRVTNSTEYRPGWRMTRDQVNELIRDEWTVSILSKV